jgi:hypothetical protein
MDQQTRRGKPRASGTARGVITWTMSQAEATPFYLGYRLAPSMDATPLEWEPTIADLSPHMTAAERRACAETSDKHTLCWAMLGFMQWCLEVSIAKARKL